MKVCFVHSQQKILSSFLPRQGYIDLGLDLINDRVETSHRID